MENPLKKFTRKDFYFSIITGLITGTIVWRVLEFLNIQEIGRQNIVCITAPCESFGGVPWASLIIVVPILWILGVNLGYFLGRWFPFFNQFGRFAAVGFTNAAVYFGILNVLISSLGINKGLWYSVFVAVAFTIAATQSYFWNKYWVFGAGMDGMSREEFGKFFGVSVGAGLVNVGIASAVVNLMNPVLGLTLDQWANVGGVAGSAIALVFSFVGFKFLVFRK